MCQFKISCCFQFPCTNNLLNAVSLMYKNLYVSADSNVKIINFDLRNKVSQKITRNGSNLHVDYRRTAVEPKAVSQYRAQSCGIRSADEYQKFKYHLYVQKSYVPTPLRAPITTWEQIQTFLIKHSTFVSSFTSEGIRSI